MIQLSSLIRNNMLEKEKYACKNTDFLNELSNAINLTQKLALVKF